MLEHILRGTTDSLPKYSKFQDHHQFGQNDAVWHLQAWKLNQQSELWLHNRGPEILSCETVQIQNRAAARIEDGASADYNYKHSSSDSCIL